MRDDFGRALVELGGADELVHVLDADNARATRTQAFADAYPDRFWNVGCAEQNMVGMAAGMAATGLKVVASTFGVFLVGRAYEQIRNSISVSNLPVVLVGTHVGACVGADGASHSCPEDIALMRALPNLRVLSPALGEDVLPMLRWALAERGPTYIRVPRDYPDAVARLRDRPSIGHEVWSSSGIRVWQRGSDVLMIGTGVVMDRLIQTAQALALRSLSSSVVDVSVIKPLPMAVIESLASRHRAVVVVEDHWRAGGLGEAILGGGLSRFQTNVVLVNVPDRFLGSGSPGQLLDRAGMSVGALTRVIEETLGGRTA